MKNKIGGKHTPGPWHESINTDNGEIVVKGECKIICNCEADGFGELSEKEVHANARLIAAAPDLLAFAEATAHTFGADTMIGKEARAAIAKAKGEK